MNTELNRLKERFLNAQIVEKLIYINVFVFVISFIFGIFRSNLIYDAFALPINFKSFITKPWTVISYGFLHAGFLHILSNLIGLYYLGNLFLEYFNKKQLLNFYILGTIIGGILFLAGGTFIPSLQNNTHKLVGASAGVSAILVGIASYIPNYQIQFRLIGYIKLWHIAIFWLGYNFLFILASNNVGGSLAHLGGALFGFLYVKQHGNKPFAFFENFNKRSSQKKTTLKTVYKNTKRKEKTQSRSVHQEKIDIILDKISKSGYDSLSKSEKDFLFQQGKK